MKLNFSDPMRLDTLSFVGGYSVDSDLPSEERPNVSIVYKHNVVSASPLAGAWTFSAKHNNADFYDLFGPTKRSRKGNQFAVEFGKTLISDEPRHLDLTFHASHHTDMDALPRYQDIPVTFDTLSSLYVDLEYSRVRRSLGAVDDEKGFTWRLGTALNHVELAKSRVPRPARLLVLWSAELLEWWVST